MEVKIKLLEGVELPEYATNGSAGFDFRVHSFKKVFKGNKEIFLKDKMKNSIQNGYIFLRPFERALVGTGVFIELLEGKELQVRSRSGHSLKRGLLVANSPGTIDSDYRGEICVILLNNTPFMTKVNVGDKIAQGVIADYNKAVWKIVDEISDTNRGQKGFGHSG